MVAVEVLDAAVMVGVLALDVEAGIALTLVALAGAGAGTTFVVPEAANARGIEVTRSTTSTRGKEVLIMSRKN